MLRAAELVSAGAVRAGLLALESTCAVVMNLSLGACQCALARPAGGL